jgi:hypothetical protein
MLVEGAKFRTSHKVEQFLFLFFFLEETYRLERAHSYGVAHGKWTRFTLTPTKDRRSSAGNSSNFDYKLTVAY